MKTFTQFCVEAYDASFMSGAQIRRSGEGGRIGTLRKKSKPEITRVKAIGGGKTEPVEYKKPRKDIGIQRRSTDRVQAPTQERGSADVAAAVKAATKAERKKAALARREGQDTPETKAKPKDLEKIATQLVSKTKAKKPVSPNYKPAKASGLSTKERNKQTKEGERELSSIMKQQEFAKYEKETGEKATGKGKTIALARVARRMST